MKKFLTTISILFLLSSNLVAFAAFSDVTSSHKNYDAILYLQENNIINGYSDGTFKPDNTVNRAEFLKIILEGSNIRLNITENTPFSDVDNNAWYAPYLKKAYDEGWIDGYPDGTFKPAQEINKVEALKIVGEVQNWNLPETITNQPFDDVYKTTWYSAYVFYAKTNNFLEETGNLYNPADFMTRGGISEVIYRTIAEDKTAEDNENSQQQETEEPEENEEDSQDSDDNDEFTQINDFAAVSTTFFNEISLD